MMRGFVAVPLAFCDPSDPARAARAAALHQAWGLAVRDRADEPPMPWVDSLPDPVARLLERAAPTTPDRSARTRALRAAAIAVPPATADRDGTTALHRLVARWDPPLNAERSFKVLARRDPPLAHAWLRCDASAWNTALTAQPMTQERAEGAARLLRTRFDPDLADCWWTHCAACCHDLVRLWLDAPRTADDARAAAWALGRWDPTSRALPAVVLAGLLEKMTATWDTSAAAVADGADPKRAVAALIAAALARGPLAPTHGTRVFNLWSSDNGRVPLALLTGVDDDLIRPVLMAWSGSPLPLRALAAVPPTGDPLGSHQPFAALMGWWPAGRALNRWAPSFLRIQWRRLAARLTQIPSSAAALAPFMSSASDPLTAISPHVRAAAAGALEPHADRRPYSETMWSDLRVRMTSATDILFTAAAPELWGVWDDPLNQAHQRAALARPPHVGLFVRAALHATVGDRPAVRGTSDRPLGWGAIRRLLMCSTAVVDWRVWRAEGGNTIAHVVCALATDAAAAQRHGAATARHHRRVFGALGVPPSIVRALTAVPGIWLVPNTAGRTALDLLPEEDRRRVERALLRAEADRSAPGGARRGPRRM